MNNKEFNVEYALMTHHLINLSKKDTARVAILKDNPYEYNILDDQYFSIKLQTPIMRDCIGFVTRGSYSLLRGKGIALVTMYEQSLQIIK